MIEWMNSLPNSISSHFCHYEPVSLSLKAIFSSSASKTEDESSWPGSQEQRSRRQRVQVVGSRTPTSPSRFPGPGIHALSQFPDHAGCFLPPCIPTCSSLHLECPSSSFKSQLGFNSTGELSLSHLGLPLHPAPTPVTAE